MRKVIVALLVLLTLGFGAAAYLLYFDTYHFAIVQPGVLYRDGFQGMRRFENAYRQRPFKTVVNFQSDQDVVQYQVDVDASRAFCVEHGIQWNHIPIKQHTPPTQVQIDAFLKIVRDPANRPVYCHDNQGVVREGMMVAVWQKEGMGYDYDACVAAIRFRSHASERDATALMDFIKKLYNKN